MENSQESTSCEAEKIDVDRFEVFKFSRWMDKTGQLLVVTGFYHTVGEGGKFTRVAVDLLNVHREQMGYVNMNTFIHLVIEKKLMPWKAPEEIVLF